MGSHRNGRENQKWKEEFTKDKYLKPIEENWFAKDLIRHSDLAIEILPCRVTDGIHLRNGFIRMLTQRLHTASEEERIEFTDALKIFRGFFANKSIPKGASLVFYKKDDVLQVYLENQSLGQLKSMTLSNWFFEQYLTSSVTPSFTNSIAQAIEKLLKQ
jgi:hypothetical protein